MQKKLRIITLVAALLIIGIVSYKAYTAYIKPWLSSLSSDTSKSQTVSVPDSQETLTTVPAAQDETPAAATQAGTVAPLTIKKKELPVKWINQYPELPTGCEITSLATVLNYMGYDVDKEYLAEYYLDKVDEPGLSFENYFIGDPWSDGGWGCFAPCIVKAANKYLKEAGSTKKAYNLTGSTPETLLTEVQNGNPVIVWITSQLDLKTEFEYIELNNGKLFKWPHFEHCVVLIGYDITSTSTAKQTVTLSDPMDGIVTREYSKFVSRFKELSRRAVVIK